MSRTLADMHRTFSELVWCEPSTRSVYRTWHDARETARLLGAQCTGEDLHTRLRTEQWRFSDGSTSVLIISGDGHPVGFRDD